ncbi:MAG: alginate export family protein [candidate division Zixibacteria bacterium]|nr:alginate export family protein [candidate division Zixibacteria bacterium]
MKSFVKYLLVLALMLTFAVPVIADSEVEVTGQVRVRGEMERKSFDANNDHFQDFTMMRSRINIKAKVDNNAYAFVQFQDSRTFGDYTQFGDIQSSGLNDGKNVDMHQAYIEATIWDNDEKYIGFKGGRFEFNWGSQRLLGSVDWHNVGRSWEGGMLWYKADDYTFTLATLKALELNDTDYNRDFDIYAGLLNLKELNLDLLALYELDSDTTALATDIKQLKRWTFAGYYTREYNQFTFDLDFAYQTGNMPDTRVTPAPVPNSSEFDIAAYMVALEVGYDMDNDYNSTFAFGVDLASGDDDLTDSDYKVFDDLYYTGHKFNGYMDYFLHGGPNGLMNLYAKAGFDITDGWRIGGNFHIFRSAEDYISNFDGITPTKTIGSEFDLTVTTTRIKGINMKWGASLFMANDDYAGLEGDAKQSGFWIYEQTTINF